MKKIERRDQIENQVENQTKEKASGPFSVFESGTHMLFIHF